MARLKSTQKRPPYSGHHQCYSSISILKQSATNFKDWLSLYIHPSPKNACHFLFQDKKQNKKVNNFKSHLSVGFFYKLHMLSLDFKSSAPPPKNYNLKDSFPSTELRSHRSGYYWVKEKKKKLKKGWIPNKISKGILTERITIKVPAHAKNYKTQ